VHAGTSSSMPAMPQPLRTLRSELKRTRERHAVVLEIEVQGPAGARGASGSDPGVHRAASIETLRTRLVAVEPMRLRCRRAAGVLRVNSKRARSLPT